MALSHNLGGRAAPLFDWQGARMKLPIPDDWQGEWCSWSICWPNSPAWEAILMGFVTLPQRGRTWDERTGSVREVQAIGRLITDENLPLWGCIMSCRDTGISDAIRYLADRLAAVEFCCNGDGPGPGIIGGGTGGSGSTTGPTSEVDDTDTSGDPPEGWETWGAYFANKCNAAHWIIGQWRDDLERAQQAAFYAGMATTVAIRLLALAILTPIPGDEIVLMAATIIAAVGAGLLSAVLEGLEAVLTGFYEDLVCALYQANNVAAAEAAARDVFEQNIDIDVPLAEGWALSLLRHWLTADNLNRLFETNSDMSYPAADCSGCESVSCEGITAYVGEGNPGIITDRGEDETGCYVIVQSTEFSDVPGTYAIYLNFETAGAPIAYVRLDSVVSGSLSGAWRRIWYNQAGDPDPLGQPSLPHHSNYAVVTCAVDISSTEFTMKVYYGPTVFA